MLYSFFLDGHYLNLPVVDENKDVLGMVDVLSLSYATLELVSLSSFIIIIIIIHYQC